MVDHYLRIEGVNHAAVMEDTTQLSVIRGGSFLLREAVKYLAEHERFGQCLEPISTGASMGLFKVISGDPASLRDRIADDLAKHEQFRHFTFVVDVERDEGDPTKALAAVTARNRFRQMRQLSAALPPWNEQAFMPCEWDDARPGDANVEVRRDDGVTLAPVSKSVKARHDYGRDQKQAFYKHDTISNGVIDPRIAALDYTLDLNEIATGSPYRDLENKLALIYLDGNKFGSIPSESMEHNPETTRSAAIRRFDVKLRRYRSRFLRQFLLTIADYPDFRTGDGKLRIETLLWGGDEITLVLPAWKGFWALNWFYECSRKWNYHKVPLTHAGGLVFCHYKTPIFRIQKLARYLASEVKDYLERQPVKRQNRFEYAVLESIDFPTEPVRRFWERRYGPLADCRRPLPSIAGWAEERKGLGKRLKDRKGQVQSLVEAGRNDPGRGFVAQRERFTAVIGRDEFKQLDACVRRIFPGDGCEVWPWIHLLELWDYLMLDEEAGDDRLGQGTT